MGGLISGDPVGPDQQQGIGRSFLAGQLIACKILSGRSQRAAHRTAGAEIALEVALGENQSLGLKNNALAAALDVDRTAPGFVRPVIGDYGVGIAPAAGLLDRLVEFLLLVGDLLFDAFEKK